MPSSTLRSAQAVVIASFVSKSYLNFIFRRIETFKRITFRHIPLVHIRYFSQCRRTLTLHAGFNSQSAYVHSRLLQFKRRSNFPDNIAPMISHREGRVRRERFVRVLIQYIELPERFDGDGRTRASVFAV